MIEVCYLRTPHPPGVATIGGGSLLREELDSAGSHKPGLVGSIPAPASPLVASLDGNPSNGQCPEYAPIVCGVMALGSHGPRRGLTRIPQSRFRFTHGGSHAIRSAHRWQPD